MRTSLNIVFVEPHKIELRHEPVGTPAPNEILIKTRRTLISTGTELNALLQRYEPTSYQASWMKYPFNPGYSNIGEVLAVGSAITTFKPGDLAATRVNHRQFSNTTIDRAAVVPPALHGREEEAAFCAIACIVQNGIRAAEPKLGDVVAVVGLGLLGQLAVQFALVAGARYVVAIDPVQKRRDLALAHGATHAVSTIDDAKKLLAALTRDRLADTVYEITGLPHVLAPALGLCRKIGTLLLLGTSGNPSQQHLSADFVSRGLKIIAAHDVTPPSPGTDRDYWSHPHMSELFLDLLATGRLRTKNLITHRFKPTEAQAAYDTLINDSPNTMGVTFEWPE